MQKKQKNKGSVLAMMALLILLLSLSSMALIGIAREARVRTAKNVSNLSARLAADAGVERALYLMNRNLEAGTWTLDDVPTYDAESLTASGADYTVTFEGDLDSGYQLTSVGTCGLATRTVRVTIELNSPFASDYAVLTNGGLDLQNTAFVKGYNSADPTDPDIWVKVGTLSNEASSIIVDDDCVIYGDVYIPPDGDPDLIVDVQNEKSITGVILNMPNMLEMPAVTPPDFGVSKGAIEGEFVTLTSSDSGEYTKIDIPPKGRLTINGDVTLRILEGVELDNQAELVVTEGSTLKLYFDRDIRVKNSAEIINVSKVPDAIQLYGTGENQVINMSNSTDIYAVVYAPNTDIVIYNSVGAYGCFIVDTFRMENNGSLHYDKALKEITVGDELAFFTVTHWEEL